MKDGAISVGGIAGIAASKRKGIAMGWRPDRRGISAMWHASLFVLATWALASLSAPSGSAAAAELYDAGGQLLDLTNPSPGNLILRRQPVLFVHGHAADFTSGNDSGLDDETNPNYRKNWWNPRNSLPSFKLTLDHGSNSGLDIEPYYIRFADQARSITEDTRDVGIAVDFIVQRHNPGFNTAAPTGPPSVQLVILAYSKGTISTRQYLKSLQVPVQDPAAAPTPEPQPAPLPAPRPNYRPVSVFVAISPPNHGLATPLFGNTDKLSARQLYNNRKPANLLGVGCGDAFPNSSPQADHFIERLNGDPVEDGHVPNAAPQPAQAPGSRRADQLPHEGTLYVALYATSNDDMVGGHTPSNDCRGRGMARNLAGDAGNIEVPGIPDDGIFLPETRRGAIHANTVHFPRVICLALFAAAHHRSPAGQACNQDPQSGVPTIPLPQPAAAMLALDISGSMLARACTTCPTRYDTLRQAVEIFAQLWSQMGRANDRLGVTYFRTTIDEPVIGGERLPLLAGNVGALIADVNGQNIVSTNLTAMGGALQRSVEALRALPADQAEARHVILFSDGMQNVNPMVQPPSFAIVEEPGRPPSGVAPTSPPMRLDAVSPIKVHTISVGAGASVSLLADIAAAGGGLSRPTLDADDLRQFFVEQLIDTLRGSSPQLIGYRRGVLGAKPATESFVVNKGVRKLLFKASWPSGQRFDIRIFRNRVDVTSSAKVVSGNFYRILAFNFAPGGGGDPAVGEWRMHIAGKSGANYEAAAIVDDKVLRYRTRLERVRDSAGASLRLGVALSAGALPVDGPIDVTATITRPRVAIGNLLVGTRPLRLGSRGTELSMSTAERRIAAFLLDSQRNRKVRAITEPIHFESDGRGGFRATIWNATVPGIYRATVRIRGEHSRLGRFERSETITAVVPFGDADRTKSQLSLRVLPGGQAAELTLRPTDRQGNLLGPTFARDIVLTMSAGRIERGPDDLGDGRYRFVLALPKGDAPKLTIAVGNQSVFVGTIDDLRRIRLQARER